MDLSVYEDFTTEDIETSYEGYEVVKKLFPKFPKKWFDGWIKDKVPSKDN